MMHLRIMLFTYMDAPGLYEASWSL